MPAWSGLWNGVFNETHSLIGKPNVGRRIGRALKGVTSAKYKELVLTLVNGAVGDTALATHTAITAQDVNNKASLGGVRAVETITDINRATVAADATTINNDIIKETSPTFPVEKSGNSGGGRLGF